MQFFESGDIPDSQFVANVAANTKRYLKLFAEAADSLLPRANRDDMPEDVFDVLACHVSVDGQQAGASPGSHAMG